ncbi:3-oxoacyl-ACP synthase III family protein [Janthinobacterium agaricidamnosum]|uniref:3-oxoacyl-(Acyl-carrier-protein) synthase III n=1 Tax=Janthinobacterium agaricidamnosum NBRC 102515 = DSM 9628 TaxID=1349767 RepID=W0V182_9BURK|nr:ketoacyl-ACP synthase III [Janthinobacterium agaricidamnosum]CDG82579.1 3-oxoacyl-(Acyl-carrier-protein) synthase III [Janthinobacterium agaricidamnosum NBRC 102515 = DSM 9628]
MAGARLASGLPFKIANLAVRGLVCALPRTEIDNASLHDKFGADGVADVCKMIGVDTRRRAVPEQTSADLCQAAAQDLLEGLKWTADSVDALIFISQTPDYTLPATACALHGRLGLDPACAAFDVNLGCSGYAYGLWLAARLLDGLAVRRVLLLVGDTISKTVDPDDRATALLFGDAGSATALEFDDNAAPAHFILGTDGSGERHLMMPASGYRRYLGDDARLAQRDPACLYMDGGEIFNFTLKSIPPLVQDLLALAERPREQVDAFLFHQANTFMLKHIIKKAKIAPERAPLNMARFGNTSSASIPLLIADQLQHGAAHGMTLAMFGFGVGYSWAAALLELPPLAVNRIIEL